MVATTDIGINQITRPYINADGELVEGTRDFRSIVRDDGTKNNNYLLACLLMYACRNDRMVRAKAGLEVTQNIGVLMGSGMHEFTDPIEAIQLHVTQFPTNGDKVTGDPIMYRLGRVAPVYNGIYIGPVSFVNFEFQHLPVEIGCTGIWYSLYPEVIMDASVLSSLETIQVFTNGGGGAEQALG